MSLAGNADLQIESAAEPTRAFSTSVKFIYALFLLILLLAAAVFVDFVVLTAQTRLPRDTFLMGFAGNPDTLVDDTRINSAGFTGDVVGMVKPPGTIRILTLGGSSMFNRRMTERLKDRFAASSSQRVEVIGGALRTHTTASSVIKYKLFSKYKPDFVLIYDGINDLWANHVTTEDFS